MAQLIAKEVVKRYRRRVVVDAVSLQVASGEVVALTDLHREVAPQMKYWNNDLSK